MGVALNPHYRHKLTWPWLDGGFSDGLKHQRRQDTTPGPDGMSALILM